MKTGLIIGIIVAIIVIGAVVAVVLNQSPSSTMNSNNQNPPVTNNQNPSPQPNPSPSPSPQPSPGPKTVNLQISNFAFVPSTLTINKGDTVVWTNQDSMAHTVTSDSGSELSSSSLSQGQTYSHTFNTAGTFTYHCNIHPGMKATIIVQ